LVAAAVTPPVVRLLVVDLVVTPLAVRLLVAGVVILLVVRRSVAVAVAVAVTPLVVRLLVVGLVVVTLLAARRSVVAVAGTLQAAPASGSSVVLAGG